jgi:gluconolactonase
MSRTLYSRRAFLRLSALTFTAALAAACQKTPKTKPVPTFPAQAKVIIVVSGLDFPEGPAFDPQGNLWCTEMDPGNLIRWDGKDVQRIPSGGRPNGLAFDYKGIAWVPDSQQNAIRTYDPAADKWETVADSVDGKPLLTPNDVSFDAKGNLLFTCPNFANTQPTGYVCCLKPDGTVFKVAENFYQPNGLDIVDGGKTLLVADTFQKAIFKGAWDADTCTWSDPQPWAEVGGAVGPDGMVPGTDGLIYQAIYGDGVVRVVDGQGQVIHELKLPDQNPTNVTVDPSGKLGLVVTGAQKGYLLSLPEINPGVATFDGKAA